MPLIEKMVLNGIKKSISFHDFWVLFVLENVKLIICICFPVL